MKSIKTAVLYFLYAYLLGTVVGFITFYINVTIMWISLFTLMPVIFGYYFYRYLKITGCEISKTLHETFALILFWIIASFILDAVVYIIIIPLLFGYKSNWTFFIDQSPWIWLNYFSLFIIGIRARYFFLRSLKN